MISPSQIRAARALLNVSQTVVANNIGIAPNTLSDIETGKARNVPASRLQDLQTFYERNSIEFLPGDGVKRNDQSVIIYQGAEGFQDFYDDVYDTAKTEGGSFCVSNVSEEVFDKWHKDPERFKKYLDGMAEVIRDDSSFNMRIIIEEGDRNFRATHYAQYRWAKPESFSDVSFYVYGSKLAILIFEEEDVYICVIPNQRVADAYRKQFNITWEMAIDPDE